MQGQDKLHGKVFKERTENKVTRRFVGKAKYRSFAVQNKHASIAQLDRASDFGSEGLGFESLWVYTVISPL